MEAKAVLRFVRVTPRKARMVVDLIRGKNAEEAMTVLKFTPRRAARIVVKVLKSAVANAIDNDLGDVDSLRVSRAFVDVGPTMKRMRPRAMGRGSTILKRTSHITLVVGAEEDRSKERSKPTINKKQPAVKEQEKKKVKSTEKKKIEKAKKAKEPIKKKAAGKRGEA